MFDHLLLIVALACICESSIFPWNMHVVILKLCDEICFFVFLRLIQDALNKSSLENYSYRARDSLACWMPDCIRFNLIEAEALQYR